MDRIAIPQVLERSREKVLQVLNSKIKSLNGTQITWSQLVSVVRDSLHPTHELHVWLTDKPLTKGTFLKTLYLSQLQWNNSWTDIVKQKTFEKMTVSDWRSLEPIEGSLIYHAPYILPQLYKRKFQIEPRVRCRRLSLFEDDPR
jgi:hypothetical protein